MRKSTNTPINLNDEQIDHKKWLVYAITIYMISRLIIALCIYFGQYYNFFSFQSGWNARPILDILSNEWDSAIYMHEVQTISGGAFFPVYPLLIKMLSLNGFFDSAKTGILINQVMFIITIYILTLYLYNKKLAENDIKFAALLLAVSPINQYVISTYAEPTMLLFSILGLYALQNNKYYWASACAGILSGTKAVGGSLAIIILLDYFIKKRKFSYHVVVQSLISVSGILLYSLYCYKTTGNFLNYIEAEKSWGRSGWILSQADAFNYFFINCINGFSRDVFTFFFALILSFILFKHKYTIEGIFNLLNILPAFISGSKYGIFYSSARLDGAVITFYIGITLLCINRGLLKQIFLMLSVMFLLESWVMWVGHHWLD